MRGDDGGKQVKGRKRHLLVDTEGFVLAVAVHPADLMDRDSVKLLLPPEAIRAQFPRLWHVRLGACYNGRGKGKDWIESALSWSAEVVRHPPRYQTVWVPNDVPPDQVAWSLYLPSPGFRTLPRPLAGWLTQSHQSSHSRPSMMTDWGTT